MTTLSLFSILGSGVRINCISPGQIDVGVDLKSVLAVPLMRAPSSMIANRHTD